MERHLKYNEGMEATLKVKTNRANNRGKLVENYRMRIERFIAAVKNGDFIE